MKIRVILLILIIFSLSMFKLNSAQSDNYKEISNINTYKTFNGYIKQRPLTKLSFQTDGKISFMPYKKGELIKKGQVIARLDGILYKIKKEKFNLNNEINFNIIIAPFDCYIEEIYFQNNSWIRKGEPVVSIYPTNKTEAEILISAQYINKINLDEKICIECKNNVYDAKINNISKSDDNYIVNLEFDKLYPQLKNGMNINAKINLSK